jgi:hypothetical protein
MLPNPLPLGWVIAFTASGAIVYWCKWGPNKLRAFALSAIVDLLPVSALWKSIIEVLVFTALGCFIGIGLLQPINAPQAVTAGFAWTGAFAKMRRPD